jgi:hypothetical protein
MASRFEPTRDNPLRPLGSAGDASHDAIDGPDDEEKLARTDALPEHERDDDSTIGGGVMGMGGTTVDRGTGTLTGEAQGDHGDHDDEPGIRLDDADEALGRDRRS